MKSDNSGNVRLSATIQEKVDQGELENQGCLHLSQVQDVVPSSEGCEDCLKIGDDWVNLRLCLTCGQVGCCDSSKNKHATQHYHDTDHPIIASFEKGENWLWCYQDQVEFDV